MNIKSHKMSPLPPPNLGTMQSGRNYTFFCSGSKRVPRGHYNTPYHFEAKIYVLVMLAAPMLAMVLLAAKKETSGSPENWKYLHPSNEKIPGN
jgi:hypothetical protein